MSPDPAAGPPSLPENDLVAERRDDNVVILRLNRPEARNALTNALMRRIGAAILTAEADPRTRVVVITGTGERAFCSGLDLAEFAGAGRGDDDVAGLGGFAPDEAMAGFRRLLDGGATVPVVGAANGTAVAGGLELLLACDVIVATPMARFGLPEVKRGLIPGGPGIFLGSRVPLGVALELILSGDTLDGERAYQLGLVNALAPVPGQVLDAALAIASRIAANGPLAVTAVKELVRLAAVDPAAAVRRQTELVSVVFGSEDAKEGAKAFVEKRPAVWQGR